MKRIILAGCLLVAGTAGALAADLNFKAGAVICASQAGIEIVVDGLNTSQLESLGCGALEFGSTDDVRIVSKGRAGTALVAVTTPGEIKTFWVRTSDLKSK